MANGKKKHEETAVTPITGYGALAEVYAEEMNAEDERGFEPEKALTVYCDIRQKDLKSDDGRQTLRPGGGFRFRDPAADEPWPDEEELRCTVVASFKGRVYFAQLTDALPTCKSTDGISGSRDREVSNDGATVKFGLCADCVFGQFIGENRPDCREIRNLCVVRRADPKVFVMTLGPSGLKPWRIHDQKMLLATNKERAKKDLPPVRFAPHHKVLIRITTDIRLEPKEHFVPVFMPEGPLPVAQRSEIQLGRTILFEQFGRAIEAQEHRVEDYLGPKPSDEAESNEDRFCGTT